MGDILIPVFIFFARMIDVTMGTIRAIFVSRGVRIFSALLGFIEALIWLIAIGQIMRNLTSPWHYIAYAAGFGMGNFVGISIEQRLSMGNLVIRIMTKGDDASLVKELGSRGYGVTMMDGQGVTGPVKVIYTVIRRRDLEEALNTIRAVRPDAFYTVEDVKQAADRDLLWGKWTTRNILRSVGDHVLKRK